MALIFQAVPGARQGVLLHSYLETAGASPGNRTSIFRLLLAILPVLEIVARIPWAPGERGLKKPVFALL